MAIGLHCGPPSSGGIGGGDAHAAFTALGDTVNTAARLEGLAKTGEAAVLPVGAPAEGGRALGLAGRALTADIRGRQASVAVRLFEDGAALASSLKAEASPTGPAA